ncbi:MAG: anthranilate synthase component II [Parvularcula sp.]
MIIVVDCYDSFVQTLARYIREAGRRTEVHRYDGLDFDWLKRQEPEAVVLSPGPGRPSDFEKLIPFIAQMPNLPILGVCLGHQILIEAYGGETQSAGEPIHGEASPIGHDEDRLFDGVDSPFLAGRYHSLVGHLSSDKTLRAIAWLKDKTPMAVRHRTCPHIGLQFHPESLLTPTGRIVIENFLTEAQERRVT